MSITIYMPALSPTMEMGNIIKWHKAEGDKVSSGDIIAEIETDKAVMEFESADDGILGKILVAEGSVDVKVNEPIAVIVESEGDTIEAVDTDRKTQVEIISDDIKSEDSSNNKKVSDLELNNNPEVTEEGIDDGSRIFISPVAKRIAQDKGINLENIHGSGPNGRILRKDIESYEYEKSAPEIINSETGTQLESGVKLESGVRLESDIIPTNPSGTIHDDNLNYSEKPIDTMRSVIAERLQLSNNTIPSYTLNIDASIKKLNDIRKSMNNDLEDDIKLSFNHFLIKITSMALLHTPEVNTSWEVNKIHSYKSTDIGIAVAIDNGLITPIIRSVERKGLLEIRDETSDLIVRAREKKLLPSEYQGGTISISNLGSYGIKSFTSIINPPQSSILSIGAARKVPVVQDDAINIDELISITLTADHRLIDGAVGAKFIAYMKQLIENPNLMLL
ncbi:MAG: pyruvate dehydrogenase complex dihydrolipoamide acetyltransferase [Rhodobiaceae bacterium]|nr:pyruvate dehydrogenase complex dihydrolipoamide acetyltransferase [Rhodobiaceae bacterium]